MGELVQAAAFAMFCVCEEPLTRDEDLALIARVWSLTEEPESMVEEAIRIGEAVGPVLRRLFTVGDHEARWQIMSALPRIGALDVELLQLGTRDADAYVRRRAWIALHEVSPPLAMAGAKHALGTELDDDLRRVLREIVAGGQ